MKKKVVAMGATVALAAVAFGGATLAYFTDTTDVAENTFTVGNIEILLDEAVVDEYGVADEGKDRTSDGNEYKLIPGQTYVKDPTVTVEGTSEPCYVRMFVAINMQDTLDTLLPNADLTKLFGGFEASKWSLVDTSEDGDVKTYEFRYIENGGIVDARTGDVTLPPLFTSLTVPGTLTEAQIGRLDDLQIDVYAHAIQSANFENADQAWDNWA